MRSLAITSIILLAAKAAVSSEEYNQYRPKVLGIYVEQAAKENKSLKPLTDSGKSNAQVAAELRDYLNGRFHTELRTDDLEALLAEAGPGSGAGYKQYLSLDKTGLKEAALRATQAYKAYGDYKDFSPLYNSIQDMVIGYYVGNQAEEVQPVYELVNAVQSELLNQIDELTEKRQGVASREQLVWDAEYKPLNRRMYNFLDSVAVMVAQLKGRIEAIRGNNEAGQLQAELQAYRQSLKPDLLASIFVLLASAHLSEEYVTAQNCEQMKARATAMINAFSRIARTDPAFDGWTHGIFENAMMMKRIQFKDNEYRDAFFDAVMAAMNNNSRKYRILL